LRVRRVAPLLERRLECRELATAREVAPHRVARALRAKGFPGVSLLESALDVDGLGRFSFVAASPVAQGDASSRSDPLAILRERLASEAPAGGAELAARAGVPFAGGAVLVLAYDYGRRLERWPERARPLDAPPPDLVAHVYDAVLAWDHGRDRLLYLGTDGRGGLSLEAARAALAAARALPADPAPPARLAPGELGAARSNFTAAAFRRAVARVRRYIRSGDVYQVNVAQRFTAKVVDGDRLYAHLRALSPAPFMADVDLGGGQRVLSSSPERFLRLTRRGEVDSWPIKGTRPRGRTPREDAKLRAQLLASEKDAAELAMIVDLVRNDLGRVARTGSVSVREARRAQAFPTVHHTVGVVAAELDRGVAWDELVRAAFPPASVTGAPKLRACEIVDELEPCRRGVYTGALGYVGWDGALDLAVLIRTVFLDGDRASAHAGSGIVLGSDPEAERRETLAKARALLSAFAGCGS
jgi:para-aminobenzoate synthetase component 1